MSAFRPRGVLAVSVGLGVALAGVSGVLIATLFPFTVLSGDGYQLKSFVVTVLGGFGNPVGALLGGVALGLLEGAVTPFVPVSWTLVIEFVLFVLVLIAFPGGIFRRGAERCDAAARRSSGSSRSASRCSRWRPSIGNNVELRESLLLAALYITLASNLNLMLGYAGYINFGSIVFFGLGGYICVWLVNAYDWPLALSLLAAGVCVSALALIFGLGILRLRGAFFALATIGVIEAVQAFAENFTPWGGSSGIYISPADLPAAGRPGARALDHLFHAWSP